MVSNRNVGALLVAFTFLVISAGCRKATETVEGSVVLDGKPVAEVTLQFTPITEKGRTTNTGTDSEGNFTAEVLPGEYKLTLYKPSKGHISTLQPTDFDSEKMLAAKARTIPIATRRRTKSIIPAKYQDENKTDLQCTVPTDGKLTLELHHK